MNSERPAIILFFVFAFLWAVMFSFAIISVLTGTYHPRSSVDLSFLTIPLMGITFINTGLWLGLYVIYPFVRKKVINQHLMAMETNNYNKTQYRPLVSIIIPAKDEEGIIRKTVLNLLNQSYRNIEVIIICHNSSDRTYQEAQIDDTRVKAFELKTTDHGKGIALNYGVDYATGEYICIVDADAKLSGDFLKNAMPLFNKGYAAIQGKVFSSNADYNLITKLITLEGDLYSWIFMFVRAFLDERVPLGGTGVVIRKDVLIKLGKFSNSLIDDFELSFRLYRNKYRIAYAPMSIVYDEKPPVLGIMFRQRARWMKGHIDHLNAIVAEPKDIIGHIYWMMPVSLIASMLAIGIASFADIYFLLFGYAPYSFASMPVIVWFITLLITYCIQIAILINNRQEIPRGMKSCFLYPMLLSPFSTYWYVCIVKAFFVKSWGNTKTTHGYEVPALELPPIREELN